MGLLFVLAACGLEGQPYSLGSSFDTEARANLPSPANTGGALFEGSLGPPAVMVTPVAWGRATLTREGSSGPPMLPPGEAPGKPLAYEVEGPDPDGYRSGSGGVTSTY